MINTLKITHLRNLNAVHINLAKCNVFFGKNGSGKTSLLEAVFLLSRGKSFRHHEPKRYISHTQRACTIWANTHKGQIAVQKLLDDKGMANSIIKKDGQFVQSQSVLSATLPTLIIDPSGMELLEEGSASRRQLLDWLAFHVKHDFHAHWLSYQRLLKQRNSLLKSPNAHHRMAEMSAWDNEMGRYAHALHECRQAVFDEWQGYFVAVMNRFLPKYANSIKLGYQAGFDKAQGLFVVLQERVMSDLELGYTRVGAHRADITVGLGGIDDVKLRESAVNVLSRGEKKLLIMALKLSQIQMICHHGGTPVVLIDDLDAELDDDVVAMLLDELITLPCQLVITTLKQSTAQKISLKINRLNGIDFKMFHVEHGVLSEWSCG